MCETRGITATSIIGRKCSSVRGVLENGNKTTTTSYGLDHQQDSSASASSGQIGSTATATGNSTNKGGEVLDHKRIGKTLPDNSYRTGGAGDAKTRGAQGSEQYFSDKQTWSEVISPSGGHEALEHMPGRSSLQDGRSCAQWERGGGASQWIWKTVTIMSK